MTPNQSQGPMDINHFQNGALNLVYNVCSIACCPVEMALRPQYGSRYFPPIILMFSAAMMIALPIFSELAETFGRMVPFMRFRGDAGMFGITTLSRLFFLGAFVHGLRVWRRMVHMDREEHSQFEGPPLPIFSLFPGSFWIVRILYEPIFVFALGVVLPNFFVLQASAAHYLMFAGVMLAMKQYCAWYIQWQFLRSLMDMRNTGPIIAKLVDNTATEDELATVHLASLPKNIPDDVRRDTADHLARAFAPGAEIPR